MSSHPTAFPDPRAIDLGWDEKLASYSVNNKVVYRLADRLKQWGLLDELLDGLLVWLLDGLLDGLLYGLFNGHFDGRYHGRSYRLDLHMVHYLHLDHGFSHALDLAVHDDQLDRVLGRLLNRDGSLEDVIGNAMKKSMVRRVRRNPEIAVKILHKLSSNRIFKDIKGGGYHFENTMSHYKYSVYKYMVNVFTEGLHNKDPKATMYNFQLWGDQVAMDNPETKNMDAINCRYMLDCAEAELAVAAGLIRKGASRADASKAFREFLRMFQTDKARFDELRYMLRYTNISKDLLGHVTSSNPNGIISIRKNGNRAAHCGGKREGELQASIGRQPIQLQPCLELLRDVGRNYR